jgi:hypothetical protein
MVDLIYKLVPVINSVNNIDRFVRHHFRDSKMVTRVDLNKKYINLLKI